MAFFSEGVVIGQLLENDLTAIAAIQELVPRVGDGGSCRP